VLAIGGLVLYGNSQRTARLPKPKPSGDDFLDEVRGLAQTRPSEEGVGTLPPVQGDQDAVAVMEVEPSDVLDIGVIPRDGIGKGILKVYNRGKAPLEITDIYSNCGRCTRAFLSEEEMTIPPGEDVSVDIRVYPSGIPGFVSNKKVTIMSTAPKNGKMVVVVHATVDPEFEVEPDSIDFGTIRKGQKAEKAFLVRQLIDEPLEFAVSETSPHSPDLDVRIEKLPENAWIAPGKAEYSVHVSVADDVSPGRLFRRLVFTTNYERVATFPYIAQAEVESFYGISPSRPLYVGNASHSRMPRKGEATITAERPFEIVDLSPSTDDLLVTKKPGEEPNTQIIEVELKPDTEPGMRKESVHLALKSDGETVTDRIEVNVNTEAPARRS
jgi:hypothetical protein